MYFGTGVFREKNTDHASPIVTDAGKGRFVRDVQRMLSRLGDIATPQPVAISSLMRLPCADRSLGSKENPYRFGN